MVWLRKWITLGSLWHVFSIVKHNVFIQNVFLGPSLEQNHVFQGSLAELGRKLFLNDFVEYLGCAGHGRRMPAEKTF